MFDPEFDLKKWTLATMKAHAGLTALVPASRIFATLGEEAAIPDSPYIVLGNWTATGDGAECLEGYIVQMVIDCYSHGPNDHGSGALVERIAAQVRRALARPDFDLTPDAKGSISHRVTRLLKENGATLQRAMVSMEGIIDEFND